MAELAQLNRNKIKKAIIAICGESLTEEIINNIEKGCFNATIIECKKTGTTRSFNNPQFVNIYSSYCYNVITNLDSNSVVGDSYLINLIKADPSIAQKIASYNPEDLAPSASQIEREIIEKSKLQKTSQRISTAHKCSKCNNNSTIFYEMQLRAADESSTYRLQCTHCYHTWYMS